MFETPLYNISIYSDEFDFTRRMLPRENIKDIKLKKMPGFQLYWKYSPLPTLMPHEVFNEDKGKQFIRFCKSKVHYVSINLSGLLTYCI